MFRNHIFQAQFLYPKKSVWNNLKMQLVLLLCLLLCTLLYFFDIQADYQTTF